MRIGPSIGIPGDAAAAGGFSPAMLGGLALWLRADLGITLNGATVSAWADQSGNGHNLTQGTAALQPLFVASGPNSQPTVRFDTSGTQTMVSAGFTLNQPEDVFAVMKVVTQGTAGVKDVAWDGIAAGNMALGSLISGSSSISAGTGLSYAADLAFPNYKYVECLYNGANSVITENGVALGAAGNVGTNNAGGFTLGSLAGGTRGMNIEFAELIIYSGARSASEVARLTGYLKARYAL